jgi:putative sigma-54 modulation protein
MEVMIQGLNMKLNPSVEEYARKKLDRLDRYLPGISDVRLDLSHENSKHNGNLTIAQITVRHRRGAILRAEERVSGDMEAAISVAVDKMYRQIQRFKGKRQPKGRDRFTLTPEELDLAEALPDLEEYADGAAQVEEVQPEPIVRRKQVGVEAMTEEEAAEQMELLGHSFFMFFNPATGSVNVVYKRESGGYGVLVPNLE